MFQSNPGELVSMFKRMKNQLLNGNIAGVKINI